MIELENKTSLDVDTDFLQTVASSLTNKDIELIITNDHEIKEINKQHRGINKSTDVLSFPYDDMPLAPLGSIVICDSHVIDKAKELNHSASDELSLLFIHGLLHLCGYDHEVDDGQMREKEKEIIEKFKLPKSLIIRTQG
jgi:probable rRNA maturation factor